MDHQRKEIRAQLYVYKYCSFRFVQKDTINYHILRPRLVHLPFKNIIKIFTCYVQSVPHLNRNMIPSTGVPWRTIVESNRTFSRLRLMAICFLYLGSQLSNMAWLSTNLLRSSKSLDWNSCSERLYRSLLTITRSVFSSAIMVAFRIQSALIRASSPKLRPASVGRSHHINVFIYRYIIYRFACFLIFLEFIQ